MTLPENFLSWHSETSNSLDFKNIYFDMADDLIAGLMLSKIVSWYLPDKDGDQNKSIEINGVTWFVKEHDQWYAECRLTKSRVRRGLKKLKEKKLIVSEVHRVGQNTATCIRIDQEGFIHAWRVNSAQNPSPGRDRKSVV